MRTNSKNIYDNMISSVLWEEWRGNKQTAVKDCVMSWEVQGKSIQLIQDFLQGVFVSEDAPLIPEVKQPKFLPDLPSRAVPPHPAFPLRNVNPLSASLLPPFTLSNKEKCQTKKICLWTQGNEEMKISSNHQLPWQNQTMLGKAVPIACVLGQNSPSQLLAEFHWPQSRHGGCGELSENNCS